MGLLGKIVYTSSHGTAQGIIPRFFIHFEEMSNMAFVGDAERKSGIKIIMIKTSMTLQTFMIAINR